MSKIPGAWNTHGQIKLSYSCNSILSKNIDNHYKNCYNNTKHNCPARLVQTKTKLTLFATIYPFQSPKFRAGMSVDLTSLNGQREDPYSRGGSGASMVGMVCEGECTMAATPHSLTIEVGATHLKLKLICAQSVDVD